ncbi:MAG: hypothetical protein ABW168_25210 [Sedimenticola sp.]
MIRGDARLLPFYLSLSVSLISMILDNVTTVIVFAPLTCRLLKRNPLPFFDGRGDVLKYRQVCSVDDNPRSQSENRRPTRQLLLHCSN